MCMCVEIYDVTVWRLIFLLSRTPLNLVVLYAGEGGRHECSSPWERGAVVRSGSIVLESMRCHWELDELIWWGHSNLSNITYGMLVVIISVFLHLGAILQSASKSTMVLFLSKKPLYDPSFIIQVLNDAIFLSHWCGFKRFPTF